MRKFLVASVVLFAAIGGAACSDDGPSEPSATGGATGTGGASTAKGGVTGSGGMSASGGKSAGGTSNGGSSGSGGQVPKDGVCGERGKATANATVFDGFEERFVVGDSGFGDDVCVVRFDLKRVGDAPAGCTDCIWTHLVEYSNPSTVTDVDGACATNDRWPFPASLAEIVGQRVAIGFVPELDGAHGSARMKYFEDKKMWDVHGNATFDEEANAFRFDYPDGSCRY